jgi:hypothetical protein
VADFGMGIGVAKVVCDSIDVAGAQTAAPPNRVGPTNVHGTLREASS